LGDGGFIYSARATIILGTLATLQSHQLITKREEYIPNSKLLQMVQHNLKILWFWGESAFPYFFNLIKYLELNSEYKLAEFLLHSLFIGVVNENSPRKAIGLPNPYYSISDILEAILEIDANKLDFRQFSGVSFTLKALVLMIARRNGREILKDNWRNLSHIRSKEFKPDNIEDIFRWRIQEGTNHSEFLNATQSWAELINEATNVSDLPQLYTEHLDLLRFFILVCPHRANNPIIQALDIDYCKKESSDK
jgi:hypothetical protein